jgi:hypothetical protein
MYIYLLLTAIVLMPGGSVVWTLTELLNSLLEHHPYHSHHHHHHGLRNLCCSLIILGSSIKKLPMLQLTVLFHLLYIDVNLGLSSRDVQETP